MKPFSLLIKPSSADCNLRCEYCFYLPRSELYPETKRHRMPDDVLEAMISGYMATDQPQYVFAWQGGEPLLMGEEFFRKVTALQKEHGKAGAVVANGLQTNATLVTDEFASHLAKYKFLTGVSLDGDVDLHDRFRKTIDGRGSHAMVMAGLEKLRKAGAEVNALVLVSKANVSRPREVYRWLKEQDLLFHQYIPCVEFDEGDGLTPHSITGDEWGEFLCGIYDEWRAGDERIVSVRTFDCVMMRYFNGSRDICRMGGDCRHYFVVEWSGDAYPCDFFVDQELRLGNVRDDSWEGLLASEAYAEFGAKKSQWNARCEGCEVLDLCMGDCLKHRPPRGGDPHALSTLCEGWNRFFKHAGDDLKAFADEERSQRENAERGRAASAAVAKGVRRNDPCPCGSGRKFKQCCMRHAR
jgi:uncharacterized protein